MTDRFVRPFAGMLSRDEAMAEVMALRAAHREQPPVHGIEPLATSAAGSVATGANAEALELCDQVVLADGDELELDANDWRGRFAHAMIAEPMGGDQSWNSDWKLFDCDATGDKDLSASLTVNGVTAQVFVDGDDSGKLKIKGTGGSGTQVEVVVYARAKCTSCLTCECTEAEWTALANGISECGGYVREYDVTFSIEYATYDDHTGCSGASNCSGTAGPFTKRYTADSSIPCRWEDNWSELSGLCPEGRVSFNGPLDTEYGLFVGDDDQWHLAIDMNFVTSVIVEATKTADTPVGSWSDGDLACAPGNVPGDDAASAKIVSMSVAEVV